MHDANASDGSSKKLRGAALALALTLVACSGGAGDPADDPGEPGGSGGAPSRGTAGRGSAGTAGAPGTGGSGTLPGTGGGGSVPVPPPPAACKAGQWTPAERPLGRLTAVQYRNTVVDLLKQSGVGALAADFQAQLDALPSDHWDAADGLKTPFTAPYVNTSFELARGIAAAVVANPERLTALAGACATAAALDAKCFDAFLAAFGRRALRGPLSAEDLAFYKTLVDPKRPGPDAYRSVMMVMLSSPRFLNHAEIGGTAGADGTVALTPYELANRLSYTLWQSMPDEALFQAAAEGSLATEAGYVKQVDRLFAHERTRETLGRFWADWLALDKLTGYRVEDPVFAEMIKDSPVNAKNAAAYLQAVLGEVRELTEYFTFTKKGTIADLLLTDVSVTKSPELAKVYGTQPWTGTGEPPKVMAGQRLGLVTRTAVVGGVDEVTAPFHRGALIRKRLLCDPLAQPDQNALPPGSLDAPPLDSGKTTRDRFAAKLLGKDGKPDPICSACHTQFSDIGYILEAYDTLGRYRTTEKVPVVDATGKPVLVAGKVQLKELPIDVAGVPRIQLDDESRVNGPLELVKKIADSKKVDTCFAQRFQELATRRPARLEDACLIEDVAAELRKPGGSLADAYKRVFLQASFRVRKVVP